MVASEMKNPFNTGHLARGFPLSLNQNQKAIEAMRQKKIAAVKIAQIKPVTLDWKIKQSKGN